MSLFDRAWPKLYPLWSWLLLFAILAVLFILHQQIKTDTITEQAQKTAEFWHQQISQVERQDNQQVTSTIAALLDTKPVSAYAIYLDNNLATPLIASGLSQLSRNSYRHFADQANLQRKRSTIQFSDNQQQLISSSRLLLPELEQDRRAAAIVVLSFDRNLMADELHQGFDNFFYVMSATVVLLLLVISIRHRWSFTLPLERLVSHPSWHGDNEATLAANSASATINHLTQKILELRQQRDHFEYCLNQQRHRRRRLQQRLSMSEKLGSTIPWSLDLKSGELAISQRHLKQLGLTQYPQRINLNELPKLIHPDDYSRVKQQLESELSLSRPCQFELRLLTPNNEIRHLQCNATIGSSDCQQWIMGCANDRTASLRLQQAVDGSHNHCQQIDTQLNAIQQLEPFAVLQCDYQGKIINANQQAQQLLQYSKPQLLDSNISQLLQPEQQYIELLQPQLLPELMSQQGLTLMLFNRHQQSISCQMSVSQVVVDNAPYYTLVFRQRRFHSEEVNNTANKASAPNLFLLIDQRYQITAATNAVTERLGLRRQQLVGKSLLSLLPQPLRGGCEALIGKHQQVIGAQLPLRHADGHWLSCRFNVTPIEPQQQDGISQLIHIQQLTSVRAINKHHGDLDKQRVG